ncbi:MAG: ATP-binding cassette domain-containing protein, partial [Acidimicrobiales bacterium]
MFPPPHPPPPPPPPAAVPLDPAFVSDATVAVRGASVWFGHKVALTDLSCSFGPGVTGLLGPNGAGKTTLMRAISGLIGVNEGSIVFDGKALAGAGPEQVLAAGIA